MRSLRNHAFHQNTLGSGTNFKNSLYPKKDLEQSARGQGKE